MADSESDVRDDRGAAAAVGIRTIACAVLARLAAPAAERALAEAVLAMPWRDQAREAESAPATWNRHMDAVIDAANASHGARQRVTRRVEMAMALDRAGLVLVERSTLAEMILARELLTRRVAVLEEMRYLGGDILAGAETVHIVKPEGGGTGTGVVVTAAEFEAAGGRAIADYVEDDGFATIHADGRDYPGVNVND